MAGAPKVGTVLGIGVELLSQASRWNPHSFRRHGNSIMSLMSVMRPVDPHRWHPKLYSLNLGGCPAQNKLPPLSQS